MGFGKLEIGNLGCYRSNNQNYEIKQGEQGRVEILLAK
jgi:hypothetical protein